MTNYILQIFPFSLTNIFVLYRRSLVGKTEAVTQLGLSSSIPDLYSIGNIHCTVREGSLGSKRTLQTHCSGGGGGGMADEPDGLYVEYEWGGGKEWKLPHCFA